MWLTLYFCWTVLEEILVCLMPASEWDTEVRHPLFRALWQTFIHKVWMSCVCQALYIGPPKNPKQQVITKRRNGRCDFARSWVFNWRMYRKSRRHMPGGGRGPQSGGWASSCGVQIPYSLHYASLPWTIFKVWELLFSRKPPCLSWRKEVWKKQGRVGKPLRQIISLGKKHDWEAQGWGWSGKWALGL